MKQDGKSRQVHGGTPESPHGTRRGAPQDGRQYVDVVEEQQYAEKRPTPDAREPHITDRPAREGGEEKKH